MTSWELAKSNDPTTFKDMDLRTYSQFMNQTLGTTAYGAGDVGPIGRTVKQISTGIDENLRPISQAAGDVGAVLGGLIGPKAQQIGRETGEAFPRVGAGAALTLGGLALEPFSGGTSTAGVLAGLGMLGLGTADTFAKTYTDTGSPAAGAVQAAANVALPFVGKAGAAVGGRVAQRAIPETVGDSLAGLIRAGGEYAGSQTAALGAQEIASQGISKLATGEFYNPLDPENLGRVIAGNIPFAALDLYHTAGRARTLAASRGTARDVQTYREMQNEKAAAATAPGNEDLVNVITGVQGAARGDMPPGSGTDLLSSRNDPIVAKIESIIPGAPSTMGVLTGFSGQQTARTGWQATVTGSDIPRIQAEAAKQGLGVVRARANEKGKWEVTEDPVQPTESVFFYLTDMSQIMHHVSARRHKTSKQIYDTLTGDLQQMVPGANQAEKIRWIREEVKKLPDPPMLQQELDDLQNSGANPTQLARAAAAIESAPRVDPKETPEQIAWREAEFIRQMNQQAPETQLMDSTAHFFRRLYQLRGETPERVEFLTRNALTVAARFRGVERTTVMGSIPEPDKAANYALRPMGDFNRTFVALLGDAGWKKFAEGRDVSSLENFSQLWTLAHELTHQVQFKAMESYEGLNASLNNESPDNLQHYQRAWSAGTQLSPLERSRVFGTLLRTLIPDSVQRQYWDPIERWVDRRMNAYADKVTGNNEFIADIAGLLALGGGDKNSANVIGDMLKFSDYETVSFAKGLYRDIANIFDSVKRYFRQSKMVDSKTIEMTEHITKNLKQMMRSVEEAEAAVDAYLALTQRANARAFEAPPALSHQEASAMIRKLNGIPDSELAPMTEALVNDAAELVVPKEQRRLGGQRLSPWDHLKPIAQLVDKFPILRPAFHLGRAYRTLVSNNTVNLWSSFADDKGKIQKSLIRAVGKEGSPLNKAFNKIALMQQVEQRQLLDHAELVKRFPEFASLSETDRRKVTDTLTKFGETAHRAALLRIRAHREDVEGMASRIMQAHDRQMTPDEAIDLGRKVVKAAWDKNLGLDGKVIDDIGSTVAESELLTNESKAGVEAALAAATDNWETHLKIQKQLLGQDGKGKPWYFPEVRLGEWMLAWKVKGGKEQLWGFKSKAEAEKKFRELQQQQAEGKLDYLKDFNKSDKDDRFRGLNSDMIDVYKEADERLLNSVLNRIAEVGDADTVNAIRDEFKPGDGVTRVSTSPYMLERRLVGGRERLNMAEGMIHYIDATSHGLAKRWVKTRQATILNDPQLRANPNLQNTARKYLSNITDPPAAELTTLKNLVFWNYLGLNPSSLPIEMTQQVLSLAPYLTQKGAGVGESYKYLAHGWKEVGGFYKNGKYSSDELNRYVAKAKDNRTIDTGLAQDLYATEDVDLVNTKQLLTGNGKWSEVKDVVGKPLYHMLKLARDFYGMATTFNSEVAYVSSFKFAREKLKMGPEAAHKFATDATDTTMFGGGVANRPMALYGLGKAQGVGGVMYSLQGYTFNMMSMMAHLSKKAINGSGLTPAEKVSARKAAGQMFITQAVLGGVMGLPLTAATVALVDQVFPEAQVKKNMREAFFNLVKDDEDLGHLVADGAMNGLFNALTPADVGSRFQLGNMLGVSPYDGFSWKNLAGPAATMLENYVHGAQQLVAGEPGKAVESVVPAGLRGMTRLINDAGAVRDNNDQLMFDANDTERTLLSLGFKPKRYSQFLERKALMQQAERIGASEQKTFHQSVADALQAGDTQLVQKLLYNRQLERPGYDVQNGLRQAVEIVQNRTMPIDPRRQGSLGGASELADIQRLYPRGAGVPETQRLQQGAQLAQLSGIPVPPPNAADFRIAYMVDQLMAQNPTMTRAQAVAVVQRMVSPQTSYSRFGSVGPVVPGFSGF